MSEATFQFSGSNEQLSNALNEVARRGSLTTKSICQEAALRIAELPIEDPK